MKPFAIAHWGALALLSSVISVSAAPANKGQVYDFTLGPRLFLQKDSSNKKAEEISMDGPKAMALKNPKDKKEVAQKRMVIVGKEGEYSLGFHVYWEKTPDPFPLQNNSVYYHASYPGGNLGGDVFMPGKGPEGVVSSPWLKTAADVWRTSVRRNFNLKKGTNLITLDIDWGNKWNELQMNTVPPSPTKSLEDNNTVVFAVELVTEIKRPDIKLPRQ